MKAAQCYIGVCLVLVFIFEVTNASELVKVADAERKSASSCGHVFDKSLGSIVNNTLHPSSICIYYINPPATDGKETYILLKRLLLDANDNVTITELNKTEAIFPVFSGMNDAVPLISNVKALTITIQTSSASNIVRHFEASYDSSAERCSFKIEDFMLTIQQPLTVDNAPSNCTFIYSETPNIVRSFSFDLFNLSALSSVSVTGADNPVTSFSSDSRPPDLFSHGQTKFHVRTNPGDLLVLRQFLLNSACSGYMNVSDATVNLTTPAWSPLDNGSLNLNCRWLFESYNNSIAFTMKSIYLDSVYDLVVISDGLHYNSLPLHQITSTLASQFIGKEISTNSTALVVSFKPVSLLSKFTMSFHELESTDIEDVLAPEISTTTHASTTNSEVITESTFDKGHKGKIECGETFLAASGTIENNTLAPSTSCIYHIQPKNGTQNIRLMLNKLLLDSEDNVTITDTDKDEILFPVFHGQDVAVPLITDARNVTISINTSDVNNIIRHFEVFYDAIAPDCSLRVNDDTLTIQQPLVANSNKTAKCKLMYNVLHTHVYVKRSLSFEVFNLAHSSVTVTNVGNPGTFEKTTVRPPDFFSSDLSLPTFDVSINPGDTFILRQDILNPDCSSFSNVDRPITIKTPTFPKLNNGSLILECRWLLRNPNNNALGFTLKSIELHNPYDVLLIADGPNFDSPPLHEITSLTAAHALGSVIRTSGRNMIVSIKLSSLLSNFEAVVFDAGHGKFFKDTGLLLMESSKGNDTWLLQAEANETAVLKFLDTQFTKPATVDIYDDFNLDSRMIASLHGNVWYPILSTTPRMMVVAKGFDKGEFKAEFSAFSTGCMRMSQGSSDTFTLSGNCNSKCAWIIPPINSTNTELLLDLQFIALEDGDLIEVLQLDDKRTSLARITYGVTYVPQLTIKSEIGAYVNVSRGLCPKRPNDIILVAQANYVPECSRNVTLTSSQTVTFTSPGFPNTYPLLSDCKWSLTTSPISQLMHLAFDKLQLAPNHCIVVTENGSKPLQYNGSALPNDIFLTTSAVVQFNSNKCDPKVKSSLSSDQGFVLNVTAADCGMILTNDTGEFTTVANKTLCIFQITLPARDKDNVNIIIFTVKPTDKTGNYELNIYDGPSVRDTQITNITESEMWSRTNSLIFVYKPIDVAKPAAEVTVSYKMKSCNETMQCGNHICLHPDWRCNGVNNCGDFTDEMYCAYTPVAPSPKPPIPREGGVSPTTFGIVIVFMFLMGVAVAIVSPFIIRKLRNRQYSQFRDVSVIE